ncbi:hypothetical protein A3Q56_00886 [Intoshia linei]|uniref:Uncharacterized protein n=1 Tax=Intoshia linei TaxID=1819745 RepID=A0A177BCE0_9BILA|nr:hypothetical protein A3Q56_00886 [Intoshia linei]
MHPENRNVNSDVYNYKEISNSQQESNLNVYQYNHSQNRPSVIQQNVPMSNYLPNTPNIYTRPELRDLSVFQNYPAEFQLTPNYRNNHSSNAAANQPFIQPPLYPYMYQKPVNAYQDPAVYGMPIGVSHYENQQVCVNNSQNIGSITEELLVEKSINKVKKLPAWIRDGLAVMERKKMETSITDEELNNSENIEKVSDVSDESVVSISDEEQSNVLDCSVNLTDSQVEQFKIGALTKILIDVTEDELKILATQCISERKLKKLSKSKILCADYTDSDSSAENISSPKIPEPTDETATTELSKLKDSPENLQNNSTNHEKIKRKSSRYSKDSKRHRANKDKKSSKSKTHHSKRHSENIKHTHSKSKRRHRHH